MYAYLSNGTWWVWCPGCQHWRSWAPTGPGWSVRRHGTPRRRWSRWAGHSLRTGIVCSSAASPSWLLPWRTGSDLGRLGMLGCPHCGHRESTPSRTSRNPPHRGVARTSEGEHTRLPWDGAPGMASQITSVPCHVMRCRINCSAWPLAFRGGAEASQAYTRDACFHELC